MDVTYNVQTITDASTVGTTIDTICIDPQNSTVNINLPSISADGQRYLIKRIDASENSVFILPNGSNTISNSSTQSIGPGQVIEIVSIGTNWEYVQNLSL